MILVDSNGRLYDEDSRAMDIAYGGRGTNINGLFSNVSRSEPELYYLQYNIKQLGDNWIRSIYFKN